jgi:hypothetical protein
MARRTGEQPGKAGVASTSKKLATSRHGFSEHPASGKTAGAFGKEEKARPHRESARGAVDDSKRRAGRRMKKSG